uniref:NADH dehydrogenase subunit 4L n=1 Tax=Sternochetus olivieri TaxID=2302647 RepID=UPI002238CC70|nr:NADH dehydrogenase subunit 4L [Sternochetus olivieri]UYP50722.1 NADH dehydrogenase subunit 4L [Sternochetus olivieri]
MYLYFYTLFIFFFSSMFIYVFKYKHFLLMLLSLESMVLCLYFLMMLWVSYYFFEYFICVFYLTMSVCEGALGLSMLVLLIRMYGNDHVILFDSLW